MNKNMLLIGGAAVLAYLWYKNQPMPLAIFATNQHLPGTHPASGSVVTTPAPAPTPTSVSQTTVTPPAAAVGFQAKVTDAIHAGGVSDTYLSSAQAPDTWNWFAMRAFPSWVAPAPEDMFPNTSDAHKPVDFQTWLAAVTPFATKSGLSGIRIYGGWGGGMGGLRGVWA